MPSQPLATLIADLAPLATRGDLSALVSGISLYADQTQPGDVFMTVRGTARDGHAFIPQAVARGAAAVIGEAAPDELLARGWLPDDVAYVQVADGRSAQAPLAAAFYDYPGAWRRPTLPRLETQYHGRWGVSRPCSGWERVYQPRDGHQATGPDPLDDGV